MSAYEPFNRLTSPARVDGETECTRETPLELAHAADHGAMPDLKGLN